MEYSDYAIGLEAVSIEIDFSLLAISAVHDFAYCHSTYTGATHWPGGHSTFASGLGQCVAPVPVQLLATEARRQEAIVTMRQDSYLLRFWRTAQSDSWRATLITVAADTVEQHFTSMDDLFYHLREVYQPSCPGKELVDTDQIEHRP
jgi:hypothetical protein